MAEGKRSKSTERGKLIAKKNEYTYGNNVSRIYSENLRKLRMIKSQKNISNQSDIRLGQFTQEELDIVQRKIRNRKTAGLDEIPQEEGKKRKFNDLLLRYDNTVYNQNTIDR